MTTYTTANITMKRDSGDERVYLTCDVVVIVTLYSCQPACQ